MIILKVTKNQGINLSLKDTFSEKPGGGDQTDNPPPLPSLCRFRVNSQCFLHTNIENLILTHRFFSN